MLLGAWRGIFIRGIVATLTLGPSMADGAEPAAEGSAPHQGFSQTLRSDTHQILSSRTALILAVGAAASAASMRIEEPTRAASILDRGSFDAPSDIGNEYGSGVTLAALSGTLIGAGLLAKDQGLKRTGLQMGRSLLYTGIAVTALKVAVHRTRPNGGPYSFPSGHTAAAFAVAPVLNARFGPAAGIPAFLAATGTALGRMEDSKHYLSDVIFGAAIGTAVGLAVSGDRGLPGGLSVRPSHGGAAVSYRF
jgi:hypothetical protein